MVLSRGVGCWQEASGPLHVGISTYLSILVTWWLDSPRESEPRK